jgi:hypothetical protein
VCEAIGFCEVVCGCWPSIDWEVGAAEADAKAMTWCLGEMMAEAVVVGLCRRRQRGRMIN